MKNLILVAALSVTLVACDQAAEESDEPTAEATAATEAAAATASTTPGTYEYEYDGKATTSVIAADGTYQDTQAGQVTEKGTWSEADGKVCFNPEDDDTAEQCWTTTEPDAQGVFTATSTDGKTTLTIKKTA